MKVVFFSMMMFFSIFVPVNSVIDFVLSDILSALFRSIPPLFLAIKYAINYGILALLVFVFKANSTFFERLPENEAGKTLMMIGAVGMFAPSILHIGTSFIRGGGASFVLIQISSLLMVVFKFLLAVGVMKMMLNLKPKNSESIAH